MARRKTTLPTSHAEFMGPDAEKDAIEKLAAANAEVNRKQGPTNVPDETWRTNTLLLQAEFVELDTLNQQVAVVRGRISACKKAAKKDGCDADVIVAYIKLKRRADKGGNGEIVMEHRQLGRLLRIMNHPLGHQFQLFADPTAERHPDDKVEGDATLAGEHAGMNGEPKENNPHIAGTELWFAWNNGHQLGADKLTDSFRKPGDSLQ